MAEMTLEQMAQAGRAAQAAGKFDIAEEFRRAGQAMMQEMDNNSSPSMTAGVDNVYDTVADAGQGLVDGYMGMARKGEELLWKGIGSAGQAVGSVLDPVTKFASMGFSGTNMEEDSSNLQNDMLSILNHRRQQTAEAAEIRKERSPYAYGAGNFLGETAALAPIGGVVGAGAKAALAAKGATTGLATYGGLAAEGATIGAYVSEGGNVGGDAAAGAAIDVALGYALNGITRGGGKAIRRFMNKDRASEQLADDLVPATNRINQAEADGRYSLDPTSALGTGAAARDKSDLLGAEKEYARYIEDADGLVEQEITGYAEELASSTGGGANRTDSMSRAGEDAQVFLANMREGDQAGYKELYDILEVAAKKEDPTLLRSEPLDDLISEVREEVYSPEIEGLLGQLDAQLVNYGIDIRVLKDEVVDGVKTAVRTPISPKPGGASRTLSMENSEMLIGKLNDMYSYSLNNNAKKAIREYKTAVDAFVAKATEGMEGSLTATYRMARDKRRSFDENWQSGDVLERLSQQGDSGGSHIDMSKSVLTLSDGDMKSVKARLGLGGEEGVAVLESLKQAPILEAISSAFSARKYTTNGIPVFDQDKFASSINKVRRRTRVELWGEAKTKEIEDAVSAWQLRDIRIPDTGPLRQTNLLGGAAAQARFLASGKARNFGMATTGFAPTLVNWLGRGGRKKAALEIAQGRSLPTKTQNNMKDHLFEGFEEEFEASFVGDNASKIRYGNAIRDLMRIGGTSNVTTGLNQEEY